jgi:hypothetical protein
MVTVAEIEDRIAEMHNDGKTSKEIAKVVHKNRQQEQAMDLSTRVIFPTNVSIIVTLFCVAMRITFVFSYGLNETLS